MQKTWIDVDDEFYLAIESGHIADYRDTLPSHGEKHFNVRLSPDDVLGICTHHSGGTCQDPGKVARYHIGPNHISESGCPGLCYNFVISADIEPTKIIYARDIRDITWSQGVATHGNKGWSGDENRHLLSILVMGDFDGPCRRGKSGNPTASQLLRWDWIVHMLSDVFEFDGLGIFGHYHFGKIHCPGQQLQKSIECHRALREGFSTDKEWQNALLRWNSECLPRFGADGQWGYESKNALIAFEKAHSHKTDGIQDPFTEMILLRKYSSIT